MCGICGIYKFQHPIEQSEIVAKMASTLAHRGPDGQGFFVNNLQSRWLGPPEEVSRIDGLGNVCLGHRRLSIIDLEGGRQPLSNEDQTVWVTFNGEIYNFKLIKTELEKRGHRFETNCDTEVIVHAYEEWGESCVNQFRGMFAFAIWDANTATFFMARDRLGIKPLYYYLDRRRIVFASEIKAILATGDISKEIDLEAVSDYLNLLYIPAPKSIFSKIKKLHPGHTLTIRAGVAEQPKQYWDLPFNNVNDELSENKWCELVLEKLTEAINIRLISDVPLGAFLSGGVDSSAVVALMSGMMAEPVKTSSIGFGDPRFSELDYAGKVVSRYQTDHSQQIVEADAVGLLEQLTWFYDEPFADSSAIPTYLVSKLTRERVTVALSGDGGDENFAGYRRHYFDLLENRLRSKFPGFFRQTVIASAAQLYPKADWLPRVFRAKTLLSNLAMNPMEGYFNSMSWFGTYKGNILQPQVKQVLGSYSSASLFEGYGQLCDSMDPLSRIQYVDIKTYLVDDILTKVDRASMANSLEVRVPILDHEFMELVATMPSSLKLKGREGKYIFKKGLEPLLPHDLIHRPKMGFSIPLASWLRNDLREIFEDTVLAKGGWHSDYLAMEIVREMWKKHQTSVNDFASELWAILFFASWGRRFM